MIIPWEKRKCDYSLGESVISLLGESVLGESVIIPWEKVCWEKV